MLNLCLFCDSRVSDTSRILLLPKIDGLSSYLFHIRKGFVFIFVCLTLLFSLSVHASPTTSLGVAIIHTKCVYPDLLRNTMGFTVRYTRERSYAIRRSTLVIRKPTEAVLSNLNHLNILRYRGSRAGVNKPRKINVLNQNK